MNDKPKLCIDCKHFNYNWNACEWRKRADLVFGGSVPVRMSAENARRRAKECGPTGKRWEPKEHGVSPCDYIKITPEKPKPWYARLF